MHTRNTVIMALLFVLLAGFVYFYEIRGRADREEAERVAELLVQFEIDEVTGLTLETGDERIVATRADGVWTISEPSPVEADGEAFDTLVDSLHSAKHERLVTEQAEDLEPFGLAEPEARVTVTLSDGSEHSVAIGKDTPVGFNLYATTAAGDVYSAPRALRGELAKSFLDLRDRTVLPFDTAEVRRLEIARTEYAVDLDFDPAAGEDGVWSMTAPFAGRADADTVDDILADLGDGEVEAFVLDARPEQATLGQYGLDAPWMTIGVRTGDDQWSRLLIGAESSEPEGRFAMREGGDAVFVVAPDLVGEVPTAPDALRNREVLALARERVEAIELDRAGTTLRVERQEDAAGWDIVAPRALSADASAVSRLLSAVQDLRAEGFADGTAGDPAIRVVLELGPGGDDASGGPARIELTIGSERRSITPLDAADEDEPVEVRPVTATGDATTYWVDAEELADLEIDLFDLRDKTLVEFTQADLTRIEVADDQGGSWALTREDDTWSADSGTVEDSTVDDVLWELNYLRMESVVAEESPADTSEWGLDNPRFRFVVHESDGTAAEVQIGAESPDAGEDGTGLVFVRIGGLGGVYAVDAALADVVAALVEELAS